MRTVKEVASLTGVSVRTLQYYDEIGVFKPTRVTDAGYRLYDDEALNTLQQVLFFRELDFPLKDIRSIMEKPDYDRLEAFKKQKELLRAKRDRLNRLLELLGKLEKGGTCMSFEEFDLADYVEALEQFKRENMDEVIRHWGSVESFYELVDRVRDQESGIARNAIKYYGSIGKDGENQGKGLCGKKPGTDRGTAEGRVKGCNLQGSTGHCGPVNESSG